MGWLTGEKPSVDRATKLANSMKALAMQDLYRYLSPQLGKGLEAYPDMEKISTLTPAEEQGMGLLESYASGGSPLNAATMDLVYGILTGDQGYLRGIESPITRELENITLPTIRAAYGKGGTYFGTNRAEAEGEAAKEAADKVMENVTKLMPTAMSLGSTIEPGMIETALRWGSRPRDVATLGYQEWLRTRPEYNPAIAEMTGLSNAQGPVAIVSPGQQAGGAALMNMGGQMMSSYMGGMGMSGGGGGGGCCFIFIKGNNLTENVRKFRDMVFPPDSWVAKGYKKMAKWLVPAMNNKFIYKLVKFVMVDPMAKFADCVVANDKRGLLYAPIGLFWTFVWGHLARLDDLCHNSN